MLIVETEVMKYVLTQGIFAVLFVTLLFYVLKNNEKRETQYQNIIDKLATTINGEIISIKENIKQIVDKIK